MWIQQQQLLQVLLLGWCHYLLVLLQQAGLAAAAAMGCCLGSCLWNSRGHNQRQLPQQPRPLAPKQCRSLSLQQ
jgi:hypothetical protein